jgi:hypothetical protein
MIHYIYSYLFKQLTELIKEYKKDKLVRNDAEILGIFSILPMLLISFFSSDAVALLRNDELQTENVRQKTSSRNWD